MSKPIGFALLAVLTASAMVAWSHSTERELPGSEPGISPPQTQLGTDVRALLAERMNDKFVAP